MLERLLAEWRVTSKYGIRPRLEVVVGFYLAPEVSDDRLAVCDEDLYIGARCVLQ